MQVASVYERQNISNVYSKSVAAISNAASSVFARSGVPPLCLT